MKKTLAFLTLLLVLLSSCYYDSREELYPEIGNECDTTNVNYIDKIQPVLATYCLSCHASSTAQVAGAGIVLDSYADVKTMAENGNLFGALNHESGYSPMPKGLGKLDDCTLRIVKTWIENGYQEN